MKFISTLSSQLQPVHYPTQILSDCFNAETWISSNVIGCTFAYPRSALV